MSFKKSIVIEDASSPFTNLCPESTAVYFTGVSILSFDILSELLRVESVLFKEESVILMGALITDFTCAVPEQTVNKTIVNVSKIPILTIEGFDFSLFLYPDSITAAKIN